MDIYINLAFAEINGYTKVYNAVSLKSSVELVKRNVEILKGQISSKELTATVAIIELERLLESFEMDIEDSINPSSSS